MRKKIFTEETVNLVLFKNADSDTFRDLVNKIARTDY